MLAPVKPARSPATYEDVLAAPEHMVAEILDGELFTSPRPAAPHALAASKIGSTLDGPFGGPPSASSAGPGGWWILYEPELHLDRDVLVPDLAGWRRERLPRIADVPYFDLAPDWACEVVSPSTAAIDRSRKMRIYAREGVGHLWLIDPLAKTLEVYRLHPGEERAGEERPGEVRSGATRAWLVLATHTGEERVRAEPFDAIELELVRWWIDTA